MWLVFSAVPVSTTMRIVRRDIVPNGPGSVKVQFLFSDTSVSFSVPSNFFFAFILCTMQMVAVDSDDLWFAYNLIAPGDSVMAVTVRCYFFFLNSRFL